MNKNEVHASNKNSTDRGSLDREHHRNSFYHRLHLHKQECKTMLTCAHTSNIINVDACALSLPYR